MIKRFLSLEWKSFIRSAAFQTNLAIKILMLFGALYFIVVFSLLGAGSYYIIEDITKSEPFQIINKFILYYFAFDLVFRFFLQKTPVMNIRPLLYINIKKDRIVNFTLGKSVLSFFNIMHFFFFIPLSVVLLKEGFDVLGVITWLVGMIAMVLIINFLNILIDKKDVVFYAVAVIFIALGALQYYGLFDATNYTVLFFKGLYDYAWMVIIPISTLILVYKIVHSFFKSNLYLDAGLSTTYEIAKTQNFEWLDQFGTLGTFLKNDIRLITRNKRARSVIIMSVMFLFYGLIFMIGAIKPYDGPFSMIFGAIFVSGGFLFNFGQFVPSWDSSYYNLMMSQNIKYRDYLSSKWWLMVIVTVVSTVLASFYLYFGWKVYLAVVAVAFYNIGINAYITLLVGAYTRTPIDLTSNKNAFGDKKAFNVKTLLLIIPQIVLPVFLYFIGMYFFNQLIGFLLVALAGIAGFALKNKVFDMIEDIYKKQKYETIAAYKQKN
ncbi:DUF5687 family protein [Flavobacterium sp. UBA6135]|uniref:DUF5687 family protein n=1 Tax=Flavobacterium sp. UBA6135 TaxID=1946553 RepID=UPI0025BD23A3|nr:DUF5687 family protein [Flavobacterium sp. UBA6135]